MDQPQRDSFPPEVALQLKVYVYRLIDPRNGETSEEGPEELRSLYEGKRVPDEYRKRGAANPIKYTWGD